MSANFAYTNTRDFSFILQEWLPSEEIFSYKEFAGYYEKEDVESVLVPVLKMSKKIIEPANEDSEKNPVRYKNGKVITPPLTGPIYKKLQQEGWGTSNVDDSQGAMVLPSILLGMCMEMFSAAYPALTPFLETTSGAAQVIQSFAGDELKRMFLPKMMDGSWTGTMGLTEPSAGSDVGDTTTKAFPTDDPRIFKIKGQKLFITGADNDFTDNIVNLFLARVEGAAPGVAGISLFLIPKYWVNEDGTQEAEINDIQVTGIEHKLGLHGSPTCAVSMGESNNCQGWLIGKNPLQNDGKGDGMALMFQLMNDARMATGVSATALIANAFYNARDYCKGRIQGRLINDPKGDRVAIINHEDIKRTLLMGKAHVEAMRAMIYKTYFNFDVRRFDPDPEKRKKADEFIEVATPLCKAYPSDEAWWLIGEAIQAYGGYGYCEDYPVSQLARDCKVFSIWEGTNYIQSMDLIGRKLTMKKGAVFSSFLAQIQNFYEANKNSHYFEKEFHILGNALNAYAKILKVIAHHSENKNYSMVPVFARRILTATAQMWGGSLLLEQALIAKKKAEDLGPQHFDYNFYSSKVASARYYLRNVVPNVCTVATIVEDGDTSVLDISIEGFDY